MKQIFYLMFIVSIFLIGCKIGTNTNANTPSVVLSDNALKDKSVEVIGKVYIATNKRDGNTVIAYKQNSDGSLEKIGEYPTGGIGTGNVEIFPGSKNDPTEPLADGVDPLISAYALFKTQDEKFLLVTNAGDGTMSSMTVNKDGSLTLADKIDARGQHPLSIASHGYLVYVASAGNKAEPPFSGNIVGYKIGKDGKLYYTNLSERELGARPTAIAFTEDGAYLISVELVTGLLKVWAVDAHGSLTPEPVSQIASPHAAEEGRWLAIPVGLDIIQKGEKHIVMVSEARFLNNQGALRADPNKVPQSPKYSWQTGSTSSYVIDTEGNISLVSPDVLTGTDYENGQIANCWVETSKDKETLFAANALSSSISTYTIGDGGRISLKDEKAYKEAAEDLFFSDLYLSNNGMYLNQLIGNKGDIIVFKVNENKTLQKIGRYSGGPEVGAYGIISIQ